MRIVLQRVSQAKVEVDGRTTGAVERGLLLLVGFGQSDTDAALRPMAEKVANLRIFPNDAGRFDRSVLDIGGGVLAVPQFTLYADASKGRRPEFFSALKPELAAPMFDRFVEQLKAVGVGRVETGEFGAHMMVTLENDGPVTIVLEG